MKKIMKIFLIFYLLLVGCTNKELSREEALKLIQQENQFPKVFDFEINRLDQDQARKVLNAGLEKEGIVTVQRTQKLGEIGKPLIYFTDKAKPYLLPITKGGNPDKVQVVKVADKDLVEVTGISTNSNGRKAVVEYTTAYKNITPFAVLVNLDFQKKEMHKAYFSLYDDGWRLEK